MRKEQGVAFIIAHLFVFIVQKDLARRGNGLQITDLSWNQGAMSLHIVREGLGIFVLRVEGSRDGIFSAFCCCTFQKWVPELFNVNSDSVSVGRWVQHALQVSLDSRGERENKGEENKGKTRVPNTLPHWYLIVCLSLSFLHTVSFLWDLLTPPPPVPPLSLHSSA